LSCALDRDSHLSSRDINEVDTRLDGHASMISNPLCSLPGRTAGAIASNFLLILAVDAKCRGARTTPNALTCIAQTHAAVPNSMIHERPGSPEINCLKKINAASTRFETHACLYLSPFLDTRHGFSDVARTRDCSCLSATLISIQAQTVVAVIIQST
jgi:hypothetical protein